MINNNYIKYETFNQSCDEDLNLADALSAVEPFEFLSPFLLLKLLVYYYFT